MLYQSTCVGFGYGLYAGALSRNARQARTGGRVRHLPAGRGMFAPFPSTTAFALALGAGSPCADEPCAGTLGLSATGFLTLFLATHVSIRTSDTSREGRPIPFTGLRNAPLPPRGPRPSASAASVRGLSPVTFSAQDLSTSELLRFL